MEKGSKSEDGEEETDMVGRADGIETVEEVEIEEGEEM